LAKSIIVIGGGVVGAASALRLRAAGFDVLLIDPGDERRGASFGNAGHIGTEQCDPWPSFSNLINFPRHLFAIGGPLDFRLGDIGLWLPWSLRFMAATMPSNVRRSRRVLELLLKEPIASWSRLFALAGTPSMVKDVGHSVVWMSESAAEAGIAAWQRAHMGTAGFRAMTSDELARLESGMRAAPVAGLRFSGTGQVTLPQAVREALLNSFKSRGGTIAKASVSRITTEGAGARVRCSDGTAKSADEVLISAGAWSGELMASFGSRVPLIGERGYHLQSDSYAWPDDLPPTIFEERSLVVTRFTNGLRATSFLEFGRPDAPADPRKWRRLEHHLRELGIAFSDNPQRWMGPRPTLPDYLPAIGRLKSNPRVLYAFGHQHLGLTMAAATAEMVEAIATGGQSPVDLEPLRVERFG
jgi:glycine/D-amino acid oxidase-like deaminating enzyme